MKIAKWGNSLAVRIPSRLVSELGLKEGDDVALARGATGDLQIVRHRTREEALASLKSMRIKIPADWKFDREEANAR